LFLALIYKTLGHNVVAVKIIQALLIAATCIITYKIGKELFDARIGYYSALLTALHPAFLIISSHLISENLFTFLLSLAIFSLILSIKRHSLGLYLVFSFLLALATQVRLTTVLFPIFLLGGLLLKKDKLALKYGLITIALMVLLQVPWSVRNYVNFGHFNPFADYGGVLWLGSFVKGDAHQDNPRVKEAIKEIDEEENYNEPNTGKSSSKLQQKYLRLGIQNIKDHPFRYIALSPKKILRLWIGSYCALFMVNISFAEFMHNIDLIRSCFFILIYKLSGLLYSLAVFCFGIIGMILGFKNWQKILPLYLIVGYFTFLHIVVFANSYVGIPALPYMIIFATLGALSLSPRLGGGKT